MLYTAGLLSFLFNPALNINDLVDVYDSVQNVKLIRCKSHVVSLDGRDRIAVPMNLPVGISHNDIDLTTNATWKMLN